VFGTKSTNPLLASVQGNLRVGTSLVISTHTILTYRDTHINYNNINKNNANIVMTRPALPAMYVSSNLPSWPSLSPESHRALDVSSRQQAWSDPPRLHNSMRPARKQIGPHFLSGTPGLALARAATQQI